MNHDNNINSARSASMGGAALGTQQARVAEKATDYQLREENGCCAQGVVSPPTISTTIEVPAYHDFGTALHALKGGQRATRSGWNGRGMHIELQRSDLHSKMTRPYLFMKTADGDLIPWVASQSDLLAHDWAVLPA